MSLGELASKYAPAAYRAYVESERKGQKDRVSRLLAATSAPAELPEADFDRLLARSFSRSATYGYDAFSSTARAAGRIQRLATLFPMLTSRREVLEVSCGDGLVGSLLDVAGQSVTLADIRDWRLEPARQLAFKTWDVCGDLVFDRDRFDLVIAYNATEHWPDPRAALENLLALCKPGGFVLLDFGPLFNSPWGLHAWSVGFPYPQFLFPRAVIDARIRTMGVSDLSSQATELQPTNGWSLKEFRRLWASIDVKVISLFEDSDTRYLDLVEEFSGCFQGRGLTLEEITVNSIEIVLHKI